MRGGAAGQTTLLGLLASSRLWARQSSFGKQTVNIIPSSVLPRVVALSHRVQDVYQPTSAAHVATRLQQYLEACGWQVPRCACLDAEQRLCAHVCTL